MEAIFNAGGAKQLGISNCYELEQLEQLYRKAKIKPAVVQNRFYADTQYDREIRAFCRQRQILYQSFWTLTANPNVVAHGTVQALASKYQRTPAHIFFRYLTGTTSQAHMREDLAIFDFELTQNECDSVATLL
jgi:diketogulonate reductase-like aldo/keto reductase